jgi:hypothetical protein
MHRLPAAGRIVNDVDAGFPAGLLNRRIKHITEQYRESDKA